MKLYSHGPKSNLLEHIQEVCLAAQNLEERIICACHDLGKATTSWQAYITGKSYNSPHNHAAAGGLLAALIIQQLQREDYMLWSLVALHVGAAHHSYLKEISHIGDECCAIASDAQAKQFFSDTEHGIASLLPEIPPMLLDVWETFRRIAPMSLKTAADLQEQFSILVDDRLKVFLMARSLLGRLCYQDHQSAAKQSGKTKEICHWQDSFPKKIFLPRQPRQFFASRKKIHQRRNELKRSFHDALRADTLFYFLDAPTGLGKTETMLSAAEILVKTKNHERIVFAVPQVSIADQIYEEYFTRKNCVQIWHYRKQEKGISSQKEETITDNNNLGFMMQVALQPFSESYNITTFNQVLLSMCHPIRTRCIRGVGLRDAVIIMDEFHKLPLTVIPYFFAIAYEYAKYHHCTFIFGSATPLKTFGNVVTDASRIPASLANNIYQDPAIDHRRQYRCLGPQTITAIQERIEAFHETSEKNLLVVLNLVAEGTWRLCQNFCSTYDPWKQLAELQNGSNTRAIVFLDGLVPPMLRRDIVLACKKAMRLRPITLITTQMIEVGVDLDFDHAFVDYQGLAATIQRGGRVGREGRDSSCIVEVFSLNIEKEGGNPKSSFRILCDVQSENDDRMKSGSSFGVIARKVEKFWRKEERFFKKWMEQCFYDSDLVAALLTIQKNIFEKLSSEKLMENFFMEAQGSNALGIDFLVSQYIAEFFTSSYGEEMVIIKDLDEWDLLGNLVAKLNQGCISKEEKKSLYQWITDRKIIVSSRDVVQELGLHEVGVIEDFDHLKCMMVSPPMI